MKLPRYRRPSLKTLLGITKAAASILTVACVLVFAQTGCKSKPSGFRVGVETVQQIRDGQISFEEKNEDIFVSITDRYGDCHLHVLDHKGIPREKALAILKQKQMELKVRRDKEKGGSATTSRS
jgi:hypothetical protein